MFNFIVFGFQLQFIVVSTLLPDGFFKNLPKTLYILILLIKNILVLLKSLRFFSISDLRFENMLRLK